ncbi:hypothetical protein N483_03835 [Pseudoalteromonas luteoviolacea NCIMB 1944]|uniref:Uncharacterized protein n=1 Tax=Pseudoalteromonas luteoviolacea (strain 2ta16) TaxID=1353533 RepID=V4JI50_PSEL2|nr:hypothetical protein PL2TA16_00592 [Pseudoalteromonas luteoviolacea 2ta16]KZN32290.1 hypothetical protein N483_03835 [Pseudoalteromonas luteoviolacea NCIMB 1944]
MKSTKIKQKHLISNKDQLKQVYAAGMTSGKGSGPRQQSVAIDYPPVTIIPDELQGG